MAGDADARSSDVQIPLDRTVGATLAATARRVPHADALTSRDQRIHFTYRELDGCVDELAAVLLEGGLLTGDRVGVWSAARAEWFLIQYAVARIGAVLVPISQDADADRLEHVLSDSRCRTLFAGEAGGPSDPRSTVDSLRPRLASLEHVVHFGSPEWDQLRGAGRRAGTRSLRRREATLSVEDPVAVRYDPLRADVEPVTRTHQDLVTEVTREGAQAQAQSEWVAMPSCSDDVWQLVTSSVGAVARGACVVVSPTERSTT